MDLKIFNNNRIAFILQGCPHCRTICEFIERINQKLPFNKRIDVIDCTQFQSFGIVTDARILLYSKHFDGYPCIFLGNQRIPGTNTREEIESFLYAFLKDELIIGESNPFIFNKECEIIRKGIFKNNIACK